MPLYSKASLETLRQRVDLVEVLSSQIDLQRAGASYKALCPFHDEKSPSFVVQRGDRHFHCFGCGAHGDAIQFLMQHQGMTFGESVESLAQKFGVHLEVVEGQGEHKGPNKAKLREALNDACDFYHGMLMHTEAGHIALKYLYARGIDLDFIRHFRVGFAPLQGGIFRSFMRDRGHHQDILVEAGLIKESPRGLRDFFIDRITFPIQDRMGSVVGFSARKYKEETFGGKYVNTPETPLFKKSRLLYGLNFSRRRIAKEQRAIVVEGQLDALRLIHLGFNFTVAGQGTAFGETHAQELIALGVRIVYLAMDNDQAGREATAKIGDLFQSNGVEVGIVPMPMGSDPDAFLMDRGPEAFTQLLEECTDYLTFLVHHLSQDVSISTPAGKTQIVQRISKQVRNWDNALMVHESLRKLAHLVDVPEDVVGVGVQPVRNLHIRKSGSIGVLGESIDPDRILEADLLRWMILVGDQRPEIVELISSNVQPEDFVVPKCRALYEAYIGSKEPRDLLSLTISSGEDAQDLIDEILGKKVNEDRAEGEVGRTLKRIFERNWMRQREGIKLRLQNPDLPDEEQLQLLKDFDKVKPKELILAQT